MAQIKMQYGSVNPIIRPVIITKKGRAYIPMTVGYGNDYDSGNVEYLTDCIKITGSPSTQSVGSNYRDIGIVTQSKIDLTPYKSLSMTYRVIQGSDSLNRNGMIAVTTYQTNWSASQTWVSQKFGSNAQEEKTITIDLTSINQELYIVAGVGFAINNTPCIIEIQELWLEK